MPKGAKGVKLTLVELEHARALVVDGWSTIRVAAELGVDDSVIVRHRKSGQLPLAAARRKKKRSEVVR
jgi:hypothetical protein